MLPFFIFASVLFFGKTASAAYVTAPDTAPVSIVSEVSDDNGGLSAAELEIIKKIEAKEAAEKGQANVIKPTAAAISNVISNSSEVGILSKNAAGNLSHEASETETRRAYKPRKPYKPLEITGEKVFILSDVSVKGNFSKFASENYDSYPGFKYSSELRLAIDGNIAENIRVSANLDDTNISQETKKVTLYIDGRLWNFTLGDFTTSYNDTEFTLYNKKLKGVEALGNLCDGKYRISAIASRSEGKSQTDVFTGAGMQSEYQLSQRPIVQSSENVKLDGRTLKRGSDYTIDYEDGSIILKPQILPLESRNRINVEYEYFENGKMYKRTLVGLRGVTEFKNLSKVGFTVLREEDDKGSTDTGDTSSVKVMPSSSTVYGLDYKLNANEKLKLEGETALSVIDPNILSNATAADRNIDGIALSTKATLNEKKYGLMLKNQRMGRDFTSIGKNRLDIDENKNEGSLRLTPIDKINLQIDAEDGTKTSLNDPDLPSSTNNRINVNSKALRTFSTFKFNKGLAFNFNTYEKLKKNDESRLHFHETTWQGEVSNERGGFTERARYNLRTLDSIYDLTRKQNEKTYNLGLISNAWKLLNCSVEYSKISTDAGVEKTPISDINNFSVDMTSNLSKRISLNSVFLARVEKNEQDGRKDNLITTDTKARYTPSDKVQAQVRYKEMHSKKFLLDKTTNEKILEKVEGTTNNDNYIKVEEPVTTRTGSFLVDLMPLKKVRSQLQYQFKNLININTRARMAVSDSAMAEFKVAPNNTLSTIYRLMNSKNTQSVGELMETRDLNHNIEVRKSLNSKMALISNLEFDYKTDAFRPLENTDSLTKSMKVEKDLNSILNVSFGLGHSSIERKAPYNDSTKVSLLSGFRLTPKMTRMTLRTNLDYSIEDDSVAKKNKAILETLLDYDLGGETELSANYKFTNTGKTEYEDGYRARVGKMTLTKRF